MKAAVLLSDCPFARTHMFLPVNPCPQVFSRGEGITLSEWLFHPEDNAEHLGSYFNTSKSWNSPFHFLTFVNKKPNIGPHNKNQGKVFIPPRKEWSRTSQR